MGGQRMDDGCESQLGCGLGGGALLLLDENRILLHLRNLGRITLFLMPPSLGNE